jgi:phosphotransferase family enzyme
VLYPIAQTVGAYPSIGCRTTITSHLREHAAQYFTELNDAEVDVKLLGEQKRLHSRIYQFELRARKQVRVLRVKVPLHHSGMKSRTRDGQQLSHRPRRFPPTDLETKFEFEHAALCAIRNHFESLHDPRFGTIRILDSLPHLGAIVMEEVGNPSFRQLFAKENRLQLLFTSVRSDVAFSNAGAWLRAYHSMAKQAEARHTRRAEFIELIIKFTDYLSRRLDGAPFFQNIASVTTAVALDVLPESLALGLSHGDYAMRNILVSPGGRVTVFDALARWRTAIFDDIGYFLTNLKMSGPQAISQGLVFEPNLIAHYEHKFLVGYFHHDPVPFRVIRLYEILGLLDKWSASVARSDRQIPRRHTVVKRLQHALEDRFFKRRLSDLLRAIS